MHTDTDLNDLRAYFDVSQEKIEPQAKTSEVWDLEGKPNQNFNSDLRPGDIFRTGDRIASQRILPPSNSSLKREDGLIVETARFGKLKWH